MEGRYIAFGGVSAEKPCTSAASLCKSLDFPPQLSTNQQRDIIKYPDGFLLTKLLNLRRANGMLSHLQSFFNLNLSISTTTATPPTISTLNQRTNRPRLNSIIWRSTGIPGTYRPGSSSTVTWPLQLIPSCWDDKSLIFFAASLFLQIACCATRPDARCQMRSSVKRSRRLNSNCPPYSVFSTKNQRAAPKKRPCAAPLNHKTKLWTKNSTRKTLWLKVKRLNQKKK